MTVRVLLAGAVLSAAVAVAGCRSVGAPPPPTAVAPGQPRPCVAADRQYPQVLREIQAVMRDELGLPPFHARLVMCPDQVSFEAGLAADGVEPHYAHRVARTLDMVSRANRVIANRSELERLEWAERIRVLAHELTHVAEHELAGQRLNASDQWVREGLAEWVSWKVLESQGLASPQTALGRSVFAVRLARQEGALPPLADLVTSRQWVEAREQGRDAPIYQQALLAVDMLIAERGFDAVSDYFRLFGRIDDRLAVFRAAFGEDWESFAARFDERLGALPR